MNCHRLSNLLSAYIDGELTGVEMIEIRNHLDGCPACQEDLNHVRAVKRMVGRLQTAQPSADFAARICSRLDEVQPRSLLETWSDLWQSTFKRLSPAMAAMCVVVLGMMVFATRGMDDQLVATRNAPIIATSAPSAIVMPVSMVANEPEPMIRRVFWHPSERNSSNGWIMPANYTR